MLGGRAAVLRETIHLPGLTQAARTQGPANGNASEAARFGVPCLPQMVED